MDPGGRSQVRISSLEGWVPAAVDGEDLGDSVP